MKMLLKYPLPPSYAEDKGWGLVFLMALGHRYEQDPQCCLQRPLT